MPHLFKKLELEQRFILKIENDAANVDAITTSTTY